MTSAALASTSAAIFHPSSAARDSRDRFISNPANRADLSETRSGYFPAHHQRMGVRAPRRDYGSCVYRRGLNIGCPP